MRDERQPSALAGGRVPVAGTVCMDLTMLDVTDHADRARRRRGRPLRRRSRRAWDVADWAGTNAWQVLTAIGPACRASTSRAAGWSRSRRRCPSRRGRGRTSGRGEQSPRLTSSHGIAEASRRVFACQACGFESSKWLGRCPDCGEWNSFVEERQEVGARRARAARPTLGLGMGGQPKPYDDGRT